MDVWIVIMALHIYLELYIVCYTSKINIMSQTWEFLRSVVWKTIITLNIYMCVKFHIVYLNINTMDTDMKLILLGSLKYDNYVTYTYKTLYSLSHTVKLI